ncbi:DUF2510 domain-containing protein [Microbacterium sp.]|uniref:DUF2510 domain-containing protein n=1 Tax=Microbacterium sp. TaxID=51671 RepID=UPI0039E278BA
MPGDDVMTPFPVPVAGWYAISSTPPLLRWWDGSAWTDQLVAGASATNPGTPVTAAALLRRERVIAVWIWGVAASWLVLGVVAYVTGGSGILWLLAPVPFVVGAVILESRLATRRRLLAPDAAPPFGLVPVR